MGNGLVAFEPSCLLVYRIGKPASLWQVRKPARGPRSNRFDDPQGNYGVLYACSTRLGCFVETLQNLIRFHAFEAGSDDSGSPETVMNAWLATATIGTARIDGAFANICDSFWLETVRAGILPPDNDLQGVTYLDAAVMQSTNRRLTQQASRLVHARPDHAGIRYRSRFGHEIENWAIFDNKAIEIVNPGEAVNDDDPDLHTAVRLLRNCLI